MQKPTCEGVGLRPRIHCNIAAPVLEAHRRKRHLARIPSVRVPNQRICRVARTALGRHVQYGVPKSVSPSAP
jgi:hypothetical protein